MTIANRSASLSIHLTGASAASSRDMSYHGAVGILTVSMRTQFHMVYRVDVLVHRGATQLANMSQPHFAQSLRSTEPPNSAYVS
jgi:hypothetical protein